MKKKIQIRLGGYGPPETSFSKALKFIGNGLASEYGDDIEIKYIWNIILYGIILQIRPKKSSKSYQSIWTKEGSPLLNIARKQVDLVNEKFGYRSIAKIIMNVFIKIL